MPVQTLYSVRGALEATRGTPVTPTRFLYAQTFTPHQAIATIRPRELRNSFEPAYRGYAGIERNTIECGGDFQFDQQAFWMSMAIKGGLTGTGGAADKSWAFTPSVATDDLKAASLQYGYADGISATQPAWELDYSMIDEYKLTWVKGEDLMWSARIVSPEGATQISAFTGALSDTTQITALGKDTQVFIDSTTIGTTADANIAEAEWTLTNGLVLRDTLNNTNVAAALDRPQPRLWTLTLKRFYINDTERDLYVSKTLRKIRIRTVGPALGGTTYKLDLDLYGKIDNIDDDEIEGVGAETITVLPEYDATATASFAAVLVNSLAAIT